MNLNNKVPIAVEKHSKLNLPFDHVSTGMFMLLQPLYYKHCLKGENNKFDFTSVVRPNPIVVPTFGRIRQNLRHFFVPYRLIFPNWEEWISDSVASNYDHSSQVFGVPYFLSDDLVAVFTGHVGSLVTVYTGSDPNKIDFTVNSTGYQFTRLGRRFFKIIYSLGYDFVLGSKTFKFNALALLAYARVYADWYANSQYLDSQLYLQLKQLFSFNDPTNALRLSSTDIYNILLFVLPAVYDTNSYFEDAWDNPVAPNGNQFTNFVFADPSNANGAFVSTLSNGTPQMNISTNSPNAIGTDYIHTALKKLSQYQKRHALAGARSIDRVLADYGFTTDYLRISRSIYVGLSSFDVDIKSVFATANGSNTQGDSVVGDFSGAGFGAGNGSIDFSTDEEGIFLSVSTIQPSGGYFQGYDRHNRHITREQFFNPSFDSLGVQSIEKGEVFVSHDESFAASGDDYANHFGFTGRYGEYKRSISRVSGDISLPSVLLGGHSWHLMRKFNELYFNNNINNVVHSEDFARGSDADQYIRMFTYTDFELDPFNIFLHVDNICYAPCAPLTDDLTFDDLTSQKVTLNSAGPKVN